MNIEYPTNHFLASVKFSLYDNEAIKRISVKRITNSILLDSDEKPTMGGLYDQALGPYSKSDRCTTCKMNHFQCPGHFGHIELTVPVFNPLLFQFLVKLYRASCVFCNRLRFNDAKVLSWKIKLQLLTRGLLFEAKNVDLVISNWASKNGDDDENSTLNHANDFADVLTAYYEQTIAEITDNVNSGMAQHSALVESYRRQLIEEGLFGKTTSLLCEHCHAYNPALHITSGKIFEIPLAAKYTTLNAARGLRSDSKTQHDQKTHRGVKRSSEEEPEESASMNAEVVDEFDEGAQVPRSYKFLTPMLVMERMRKLWANDAKVGLFPLVFGGNILPYNKKSHSAGHEHRIFFVEILPVPPTRFRPPSVLNGRVFENAQNGYLTAILKASNQIVTIRERYLAEGGGTTVSGTSPKAVDAEAFARIVTAWIALQEQVNFLYDSSKLDIKGGKVAPPGVKQLLEKKAGLFRKHMMGKRVNYAARSVISPDVMIETGEIGLPLVFATRLTYPEPVTSHNVLRLREAIINGPAIHPGATHIQHEDGTLSNLAMLSVEARIALANRLLATPATQPTQGLTAAINKRVWRHVRNGDALLLNRQPTLHKPSIMAHRCRVLPGEKTIRMHYANCSTYNADFDGDEMNVHCPQSELGRAEAYLIANADAQYLIPTDGSPLRGLIQDHIVAAAMLTLRDMLLDHEIYMHLVAGALLAESASVRLLPPTILRPQLRWTGKDVFSTLLINIIPHGAPLTLTSRAKLPSRLLGGTVGEEEAMVEIVDSLLLTGIIDKAQIGDSPHGLVHALYELHGGAICGALLSALSRLLTRFLQWRGFTCRMDDLILMDIAEMHRASTILMAEIDDNGTVPASLPASVADDVALRALDGTMKSVLNTRTSRIIDVSLEGLLRPFPANNMTLMTMSGAKGSLVNASQISGALGQQELEGRRVPLMPSAKTLPCFAPWDLGARAGGYISQRFLSGIRVPEFYFHCMAGREGLIDTAVKTSRSGYLQRCLVKHLESLRVHYDGTVRDVDGTVIQFLYGEDGIDVGRSMALMRFPLMARNVAALMAKWAPAEALARLDTRSAPRWQRRRERRSHVGPNAPVLTAVAAPWISLGAVSERFTSELETWIKNAHLGEVSMTSSSSSSPLTADQFRVLMWLRYMRSLVEPGEMVGVLAAQSIGEPSTQMTLNTFHFAGFGAKNVTLGIPRLREIVMTASRRIKTPTMVVPFKRDTSTACAQMLTAHATRRTLSCLLTSSACPTHPSATKQAVNLMSIDGRSSFYGASPIAAIHPLSVTERIIHVNGGGTQRGGPLSFRQRIYHVQLQFLPADLLEGGEFCINEVEMVTTIKETFSSLLLEYIRRQFKKGSIKSLRHNHLVINQTAPSADEHLRAGFGATSNTDDTSVDGGEATTDDAKASKNIPADVSSDSDDGLNDSETDDMAYRNLSKESDEEQEDAITIVTTGTIDYSDQDDTCSEDDETRSDATSVSSMAALVGAKRSKPNPNIKAPLEEEGLENLSYDYTTGRCSFELRYSISQPKLFLLPILERLLARVVVREIPSIGRCFLSEEGQASHRLLLTTEGVNFTGVAAMDIAMSPKVIMMNHDSQCPNDDSGTFLDMNSLYSNDVGAVLAMYGVEAARAVIIKEIAAVFGVYGISVDPRHLILIADYMTFEGGYRAMNRTGLVSSTSPLLKMTFESTFGYLKMASLFSEKDSLRGPSSRLVLGQVTEIGTGCMEIVQPVL